MPWKGTWHIYNLYFPSLLCDYIQVEPLPLYNIFLCSKATFEVKSF